MKISGFTFLRNGQRFGYPFVASIRSVLPLVDEFVVALGPCEDDTETMLRAIDDRKIRIVPTQWNEGIRPDYSVKGFVYGQQKSMALFNCSGDWAFYVEADEVIHENDLPKIRAAMERHLNDPRVEALAFDFLHFYGNANTIAWSPGWYRSEARIIRNTIPAWSSESLFFNVVVGHKRSRYPRAAQAGATIYHYGWVRPAREMNLKSEASLKYWRNRASAAVDYAQIDAAVLKPFAGTHPKAVQEWLPKDKGLFQADPNHKLTRRERKHRRMLWLEKTFGLRFNKRHYRPVR
ncbi:MAG: glycosyltransferase [Verrucomicrobia bacterium]|nr:glycosyltransferase [Verrucomicrobiota bacterium]MDE3098608.1 glycosyltransferase [Verrucomicrobiota bacterium]